MSKKSNKTHRTRDAKTGQFVKTGTEKKRPNTTVREKIPYPKKRKK